jgi:Holliday junction resolvase RusA-like endonuclease
MKVVVPGVPPSLNRMAGRNNVWEYRRAKAQWTLWVQRACMACKERPKEPWKNAVVELCYYFPDHRRRDADNYAGKFLLDGLTKAGVIVDDDLKHITTIIIGRHDKKDPRTEITVYGK